jgi:hypothetical protein
MTESTEITILTENRFLESFSSSDYAPMVKIITDLMPEVTRATNLFQKSQSQFMDNMLTVTALTPVRNLRQILAEMKKTRLALGEAHFGLKRKAIEIKKKERSIIYETDCLEAELLEIELDELHYQVQCINENVGGAIRKLVNYTRQYESIMKEYSLTGFTEEDFEREEERYHITRAFQQGLSAARAHGGMIDEGNQIYFEQIGINGTAAQMELTKYLLQERAILEAGGLPEHKMQVEWILSMADKFKGSSRIYARWKGETGVTTDEAIIPDLGNNV